MTSTLTLKRSSHPEYWVGFSHFVSDQTLVLLFTRLSILLRWSSSKVLIRGAFLVPSKYLGQQKPKIFWRNVWLFTNFADYGFIVYFSMCPTHKIVWFCKTEITRLNSENNCSILLLNIQHLDRKTSFFLLPYFESRFSMIWNRILLVESESNYFDP